MYFLYLDESGNTGNDLKNKDQPIHYISWILVNCNDIQKIEKDILGLEINFLPYSKNFDFEFHGVELAMGKGYFKNFNIQDRLKLVESLVGIFKKYDIKFFSQWINKADLAEKYVNPYHPHYLSFMYIIEKIDKHLSDIWEKGLVIMDKNIDTEQNIIDNFQEYKNTGTSFWFKRERITNLIDTVYYTDSYNSHLMQLSDVIGYLYSIYITTDYLWKLDSTNYVKKQLFQHYSIIKSQSIYLDIEPK